MKGSQAIQNIRLITGSLSLLAVSLCVGCTSEFGGQNLPSPYYLRDDVQYFAPGPEMKISNEAAAIKAAQAQRRLEAMGAEQP